MKQKMYSVNYLAELHGFSKRYALQFVKKIGIHLDSLVGSNTMYITPDQLKAISKALSERPGKGRRKVSE